MVDSLTLVPLTESELPDLRQLCGELAERLADWSGRRPGADHVGADSVGTDMVVSDLRQALSEDGRYLFGVSYGGTPVGLADVKLSAEAPEATLGLLLLAPPYDDPAVQALALRILVRWLAEQGVRRLQTLVPGQLAADLIFWQSQGFALTGEQFRRVMDNHSPRLLVLERLLDAGSD